MKHLKMMLIAGLIAAAGAFSMTGCVLGDASVHLTWTINGQQANVSVCDDAGGRWVYVVEDGNMNGTWDVGEWRSVRHACYLGALETVKHFMSGEETRIAFQLNDSDDNVLSRSDWITFMPEVGSNDFDVNFQTSATGGASVQITWYIHGIRGGTDVGWGTGSAQEVCALVQDLSTLSAPPGVQLWIENTGDDTADMRFDFPSCTAGQGLTTEEWQAGESIRYAFALVDGAGTLLSQSVSWENRTLAAGVNDLGTVNFYIGDYGPLEVELQWGDKIADPAYGSCDFPPDSVAALGYLLCWGSLTAGACPDGYLYDEVDIETAPASCVSDLAWDITDFGTYTLVIDGEDAAGTTMWGFECQDLVVDSMEPSSNQFICRVLMTASP